MSSRAKNRWFKRNVYLPYVSTSFSTFEEQNFAGMLLSVVINHFDAKIGGLGSAE
jgi:hypothetical protein